MRAVTYAQDQLELQEEHQPSREDFDRVTSVTGTTAWRPFYELRRRREISARAAREAYVNLMRWRLETVLGYERAHALEVPNHRGVPLYHMICCHGSPGRERHHDEPLPQGLSSTACGT